MRDLAVPFEDRERRAALLTQRNPTDHPRPGTRTEKKIDDELQQALDDHRLLFITPFDEKVKRISRKNALKRKMLVLELADEVYIPNTK